MSKIQVQPYVRPYINTGYHAQGSYISLDFKTPRIDTGDAYLQAHVFWGSKKYSEGNGYRLSVKIENTPLFPIKGLEFGGAKHIVSFRVLNGIGAIDKNAEHNLHAALDDFNIKKTESRKNFIAQVVYCAVRAHTKLRNSDFSAFKDLDFDKLNALARADGKTGFAELLAKKLPKPLTMAAAAAGGPVFPHASALNVPSVPLPRTELLVTHPVITSTISAPGFPPLDAATSSVCLKADLTAWKPDSNSLNISLPAHNLPRTEFLDCSRFFFLFGTPTPSSQPFL